MQNKLRLAFHPNSITDFIRKRMVPVQPTISLWSKYDQTYDFYWSPYGHNFESIAVRQGGYFLKCRDFFFRQGLVGAVSLLRLSLVSFAWPGQSIDSTLFMKDCFHNLRKIWFNEKKFQPRKCCQFCLTARLKPEIPRTTFNL